MALSGNQLTGFGATGFPNRAYLGFVAKAETAILEYAFSLLSTIDDSDLGIINLVTTAGQGVLSSVSGTTGYSSPMDSDVQTAYCAIFESGKSLESTI